MEGNNKKRKILYNLGIILRGIGILFLAVTINLFIRERDSVDWSGIGIQIIVTVAIIALGGILITKNSNKNDSD